MPDLSNINKFKDIIPEQVTLALEKLISDGFEAYIVGGCVRDVLLDRMPQDWDITTSAKPLEVESCFKEYHCIETGLKHGTVSVVIDDMVLEITTFRIDGDYKDSRHPEYVLFTSDIQQDLSRRDFTINAMAFNFEKGLIDCYNGFEDLNNKIIRCVGEAEKRFSEDALRIMRLFRFATQLNFDIDNISKQAAIDKKDLLKNISKERINTELNKILLSECKKRIYLVVEELFDVGIMNYIFEIKNIEYSEVFKYNYKILSAISFSDQDLEIRLIILIYSVIFSEKEQANICRNILKILKYDNKTIQNVCNLIKYINYDFGDNDRVKIKYMLNDIGEILARKLGFILKCIALSNKNLDIERYDLFIECIDDIIIREECYKIKDLAINGDDIINLGVPKGNRVGEILNYVLSQVIENNLLNNKQNLLNIVKNII